MDRHGRDVLARNVSVTMEEAFCVNALPSAPRGHGRPQIFNTDHGAQCTGEAFTGVLKDAQVGIRMDGRARAMDNSMVERLWRSVNHLVSGWDLSESADLGLAPVGGNRDDHGCLLSA
jgi:putative transposase